MLSCLHAGTADVVNVALVVGFDVSVLYFMGFKSLMYLLIGVVLGGGLHPMAGHLIAEHYMFLKVSVTPLIVYSMSAIHLTAIVHGMRCVCAALLCWQRAVALPCHPLWRRQALRTSVAACWTICSAKKAFACLLA